MQRVTDWVRLWRELVEARANRRSDQGRGDAWRARARRFDKQIERRWEKPDSSRATIVSQVQAHPGATLLDIGAGTGAWTALLARYARRVTAVDPSPAMLEVLQHKLADEGIDNVDVVQGAWPEAQVEVHDFTLCSHAMYGAADFPAFVRRMEAVTRRTCYLLLRAPTPDGVMAEASMHIWGQPYDSPCFQVAYNALLQIGIFPHVLMEDTGLWEPWTHDSLEDALAEVKRRFGLPEASEHDGFLLDLLQRRLERADGQVVWPRGMRSALVFWDACDG
jgi:SAM-dependent methyltransferase